jgi:sugar phosphate isomerase/epimerase
MPISRRRFNTISAVGAAAAGSGLAALPALAAEKTTAASFQISLAQWSLHRSFFGDSLSKGWANFGNALDNDPDSLLAGDLDPRDFARIAREGFDIGAIEYVNTFYFGHAGDDAYFAELRRRADDQGVQSLLIMCDRLGSTGAADAAERRQVVENHRPWLEAAASLGAHAIRVNAHGSGDRDAVAAQVADSLHQLGDIAAPLDLSVLVENHGGLSSDAAWLAGVIQSSDHERVGTLPDFGNFRLSARDAQQQVHYDRYQGVAELMPYARAVSAKSYDFDERGNETTIDFERMLKIVTAAGYSGYVGIEYEGRRLREFDGIRATQRLLQRVRQTLS